MFELRYGDSGIGVDTATLAITEQGQPLAVSCSYEADRANCTPTAPLTEGTHSLQAEIADFNGNRSDLVSVAFTVDTVPPAAPDPTQIHVADPEAGTVAVTGAAGSVEPNAVLIITNTRTGESVTVTANSDGGFTAQIGAQAGDTLEIRLTDTAGNQSETRSLSVGGSSGGLPPDPATVAPPLTETGITPMREATAFLYSGADPIQTGVAEGTLEPSRAAVIRGKVLSRDNEPLSGVTLTIKDHPELGQTLSRSDGEFDMAVNGGGLLTINYEKPGYFPVQRQVQTPWQDYAIADDVVMVALDAQVTSINLTSDAPIQIAQGSVSTDADGSRQATVLIPQGTQATIILPDGSQQPLTNLHVRATEYTVGTNGPKAMPGPLPPTSGYTYAVELSVDEAMAAGATRVDFSQPLPVYLDNFLDFPVGGIVPVGWYDRDKAAWVPSDNGRIVKIVGTDAAGLAILDIDGGGAADASELTALGITEAERGRLAHLYPVGKSLWRVSITHFTPWDCNWPYGPPKDAEPPPTKEPENPDEDQPDPEDSDECEGCAIEAQSQTLGEEIPITGTPFKLHYRSDRVPGRKTANTVRIPLTGASVSASLKRIDLKVEIAGRQLTQTFTPAPNLNHSFTWDGLDAYGRPVSGQRTATVGIDYVYAAVYYAPATFAQAFAAVSGSRAGIGIGRNRSAGEVTLGRRWQKTLGSFIPEAAKLGGWTLTTHHAFDALGQVFYAGDGSKRSAQGLNAVIKTVAGTGRTGFGGDGGPALKAQFNRIESLAMDGQGNLYIPDEYNHRVRKISIDGTVRTIAGNGTDSPVMDGILATQASLKFPKGIASTEDGILYISDSGHHRIRRIGKDGVITTVAGNGTLGFSGDGGLATSAQLYYPQGIALGRDGTIYIADEYNHRIRKVDPQGRITSINGPRYSFPQSVSLAPNGDLYVWQPGADQRVYRIRPDGSFSSVAGTGQPGFGGDGGQATSAEIWAPRLGQNVVKADGSFVFSDGANSVIRRVTADGVISSLAGRGNLVVDAATATSANIGRPSELVVAPNGDIYFGNENQVKKFTSRFPGIGVGEHTIVSEDASVLHIFTNGGRHLRTEGTLTGQDRYTFAYDPQGRLIEVEDRDGDLTRIERDSVGNPSALVSADGQRTTLSVDSQGYLAAVTNPAGERYVMDYTPDGLLIAFTDPKGNTHRFEYDDLGRLVKDTNAGNGGWTLARTENATGYTNAMTTAEGRTTTFTVEPLTTGDRQQVNTYPDGTVQTKLFKTNGEETTTAPDGTLTTVLEGPDPRFGMQAPVAGTVSVRLPSGLTSQITTTRTAALSVPTDPLSFTRLTETTSVNSKAYTSTFDQATRTYTHTSPAGRVSTTVINDQHRPLVRELTGLNAVNHTYDTRGRLTEITTGARTTHLGYYETGPSQGYLHT